MDEMKGLIAGLQLRKLANTSKIIKTCRCHHAKNGEPNIARSEKSAPGQLLYTCKECEKDIILRQISDQSMMEAISTIDFMCDMIKMYGDAGEERLYQIEELQLAINDWLPILYNSSFR